MAIVTWAQIIPLAVPSLPNCLNADIVSALGKAADEFCERTKVWNHVTSSLAMSATVSDYTPSLPGKLEHVWSLSVDGQEIDITHASHVSTNHLTDTGKPLQFAIIDDNSIRFYPIPDAAYHYVINCALKPGRFTAAGIEQFIHDNYVESIVSGAIAELTAMPGKAWTNPELSAYHSNEFEKGIVKALVRDFHNAPVRAKPRMF